LANFESAHEDSYFTPWLALLENFTLLREVLNLRELPDQRTEVAGGDFRIPACSAGLLLLIWALIDGNALGWAAPPIVAFLFVELCQKRRSMWTTALLASPVG